MLFIPSKARLYPAIKELSFGIGDEEAGLIQERWSYYPLNNWVNTKLDGKDILAKILKELLSIFIIHIFFISIAKLLLFTICWCSFGLDDYSGSFCMVLVFLKELPIK